MDRPPLIGKVFASLRPGELSLHMGYRYGMAYQGLIHVPRQMVPPGARMPNTRVWIQFGTHGEIMFITPLSERENQEELAWEESQGFGN